MSSIPPYLVLLIAVFVILPSLIAILLRFLLYQHLRQQAEKVKRLVDRNPGGRVPEIVENLEKRFAQASCNLDQVNTAALIDQVYSHEKFQVYGYGKFARISCEQIDYFSRILPNLLLAFGLIGTFIGITMNLISLSQTIGQSDIGDVNTLVQQLQNPLQGMGIAFITSLMGLFCSAIVTISNFFWNTNLAKYRLISSLEDYLDNVYHPTVQGQTRLDKVVKGMANTFEGFLTRFGQTVRDGVESALQDKIQDITEANLNASRLAEQVYTQLANAAGTISRGADDFQESSNQFKEAAQIFSQSEFPRKLSEVIANLANIQSNFSESSLNLSQAVDSLGAAFNRFDDLSQYLVDVEAETRNLSENSVKALELYQRNQQFLTQSLESAMIIIDKLQEQMGIRVDHLDNMQKELGQLIMTQNKSTSQVSLKLESFSSSLVEIMKDQSEHSSSQYEAIAKNLTKISDYLSEIELVRIPDSVKVWKSQPNSSVLDNHDESTSFDMLTDMPFEWLD